MNLGEETTSSWDSCSTTTPNVLEVIGEVFTQ